MSDLDDLRAEVQRRQRAANAKVARLRRKGVILSDTKYDVRREPSNIQRYNARQLESYLGKLNEFTHRSNAFVPGVEGTPIRRSAWNAYARTEREYNKKAEGHYSQVKDTFVPQAGMKIAEFDAGVRSNRPGAKGGVSRPLEPQRRQSFEIMDEKKLAKLRTALEKKTRKEFVPAELKKQRRQMMNAVSEFGDRELTKLAKTLTDEQLDTLWNYTDAPRDLFAGYHYMKLLAANKADEGQANVHENASYETRAWLEWAASLPARDSAQKPNRKNRR